MAVTHFRELIAWQKAMDLVVRVYKATEDFPKQEMFGLVNQVRRAAVSVPSNIAEGQGRGNCNEFVRFLRIARGSLQEVQTQVLIARRLDYLTEDRSAGVLELADELGRILNGLMSSLTTDN